jgi:Uncharacterized ATPase, putative transposase
MTKVANKIVLYQSNDFRSVFNQCEITRTHKLMTGLIADTGMGKTTSLKAYSQNENVFMITVDKTVNAKGLLLKILEALGVSYNSNAHDVMQKIASELNSLENPLLIIDEAGKLNHVMMLYLHDLREYTKDNCGIVLAGMPYFKNRLIKFSDKQKEGCSEFLRRINIWHELEGLNRKEIDYICEQEGVEADNYKEYHGLRFGDLMNKILLDKITNDKL